MTKNPVSEFPVNPAIRSTYGKVIFKVFNREFLSKSIDDTVYVIDGKRGFGVSKPDKHNVSRSNSLI